MKLMTDAFNENIRFFGRTYLSRNDSARFFNWTGAGFEITFSGTKVEIELVVQADYYPTEGTDLPWISIVLDGTEEPNKMGLSEGTRSYTIFESNDRETHSIKVVKRSENSKGRVALKGIKIDGEVLPNKPREYAYRLEFIGDSITCGFGNETSGNNAAFSTSLENGLKTYGAIAADQLNAEYHSICISGIPLCNSYKEDFRIMLPDFPDFQPPQRAMEDYYAYTDRFQQEAEGLKTDFDQWDFSLFRPDAIIVNLGTNDAFRIKASANDPEEEQNFEYRYTEFLHTLRRLNGDGPVIGCTLGSMDYYLYDNILRAVEAFKRETGDERVFCYKYGGIFIWGEGIGALDHPSEKTHERMGRELAQILKKWL